MTVRDALALHVLFVVLMTFGFWSIDRHFAQQDTINQESLAWVR